MTSKTNRLVLRLLVAGAVFLSSAVPAQAANADSLKLLDSLQKAFIAKQFGMYIHFNMSTFTRDKYLTVVGEWAEPDLNPNLFNPTDLDCGQWADAAKSAGMNYMCLTTKHHDGFCLWPSKAGKYHVGASSWRGGKGDVVREFVDSARSRGIAVGLYYSMWDKTKKDGHGCNGPRKTGSACPKCDTNYIHKQLTELLTDYGKIDVLSFDAWGWKVLYRCLPYETVRKWIKDIQPTCLIIDNNHDKNADKVVNSEIKEHEKGGTGDGDWPDLWNPELFPNPTLIPFEVGDPTSTPDLWFYHSKVSCILDKPETTVANLKKCIDHNALYLPNYPPDKTGKLPECMVKQLAEVGKLRGITAVNHRGSFAQQSISSGGVTVKRCADGVTVRGNGDITVSLMNLRGVVVSSAQTARSELTIPTASISAGTYLVSVRMDGRTVVKPVFISHGR